VSSRDAAQAVTQKERPCVAIPGRVVQGLVGELKAGQSYEGGAGHFILRLDPDDKTEPARSAGWHVGVYEPGRDVDLSQFTVPFSGPNPRDLFPWFDAAGRRLNAPGPDREFYFSPEVGRTIVWDNDTTAMRANIERIEQFGRGTLDVLDFRAVPWEGRFGGMAFLWLKFSACLSWPASQWQPAAGL